MRRRRTVALAIAMSVIYTTALGATTNENGYEVTRSQTVVPAPHGKIGRKTINRETRVGNAEETDGNSSSFTMTIGGFMNRCPVIEGSSPVKFVVPGDFEYSLVADTVDTNAVPTARSHYEKSVIARIKVFVNDDLSVNDGEFDGEYASNIDGVRTGPIQIHRRFRIAEGGMPDMDALTDVATATGDMAAAALMWNAGQVILGARSTWFEPNACAELEFEPQSEQHAVGPDETVEIRVNYRTREGRQPIPKGSWDATAFGSGSRVAETSGQVREDGTFVVRYTAGSNPKEGDGVRIEAASPAGYAREMWKILVRTQYEGIFSQRQQMAIAPAAGAAYGMSATRNYKTDGRLVWTRERDNGRAHTFGEVDSTFYIPADGEITVRIDSEGKSVAGSCKYEGSKTFAVKDLPPAALQYLLLEVADDGRYRLMLGMISRYLQFEVKRKCRIPVAPGFGRGAEIVNDSGIVIGKQEGTIVDDAVAGRTAAPITMGPISITGDWQFKRNPPSRP